MYLFTTEFTPFFVMKSVIEPFEVVSVQEIDEPITYIAIVLIKRVSYLNKNRNTLISQGR